MPCVKMVQLWWKHSRPGWKLSRAARRKRVHYICTLHNTRCHTLEYCALLISSNHTVDYPPSSSESEESSEEAGVDGSHPPPLINEQHKPD